mmetsp:Transcript_84816/g.150186  ORF Transcript_84816/g.150186 Transcript_84816/m.150186 type:complete len:202 (+) Transcript_84816:442-1047(+)
MVVSTTRHQIEALTRQRLAEGLCILDDLLLVQLEFWCLSLLQGDGQRCDGVIVWPTLETWEDSAVDLFLNVPHDRIALLVYAALAFPEEDHGTSGSPQGFVCRGRDNICECKGRRDNTACHEARDVGHVSQQICAACIRDLAHSAIVNHAGIRTGASNQDFWADAHGKFLTLIIIDVARLLVEAVWDRLEILRDHGDLLVW